MLRLRNVIFEFILQIDILRTSHKLKLLVLNNAEPSKWSDNIGSSNGLASSGVKPLRELLDKIDDAIRHHWNRVC